MEKRHQTGNIYVRHSTNEQHNFVYPNITSGFWKSLFWKFNISRAFLIRARETRKAIIQRCGKWHSPKKAERWRKICWCRFDIAINYTILHIANGEKQWQSSNYKEEFSGENSSKTNHFLINYLLNEFEQSNIKRWASGEKKKYLLLHQASIGELTITKYAASIRFCHSHLCKCGHYEHFIKYCSLCYLIKCMVCIFSSAMRNRNSIGHKTSYILFENQQNFIRWSVHNNSRIKKWN